MAMGPKRKPQTTRTHNSGKRTQTLLLSHNFMCDAFRIGKQNPNLSYQIYWRSFCVFNVPHTHKRKVKITFNRQKSNFFNYIRMWAIVRVKCLFLSTKIVPARKKKSLLLSSFSVDSPVRTDSNKNSWKVYNAIFWNSNQLYNSVAPYFVSIFRYIRYMQCTIHIYGIVLMAYPVFNVFHIF